MSVEGNIEQEAFEENFEATNTPPQKKKPLWLRFLPIFIGIFTFFAGLLIFFPGERIGGLALRALSSGGVPVSAEKATISPFGKLEIENLTVSLPTSPGVPGEVRIPLLEGKVSLFALIANRADVKLQLSGATIQYGSVLVRGGDWDINVDLRGLNKNIQNMTGDFSIAGRSIIAEYNEELPVLNEKLKIPVTGIDLALRMGQARATVKKGLIVSSLFTASLNGELSLARQTNLNLILKIDPRQELYQKYNDKGLKEILTAFQLLQPDGSMQFNISGTAGSIQFKPVKNNTSGSTP